MIRETLEKNPELRRFLFRRGFLITDRPVGDTAVHPFYGTWTEHCAGGFHFYIHPDQTIHIVPNGDAAHFLIGHAYDPFDMLRSESEILTRMSGAHQRCEAEYVRLLNQLSGVFTVGWARGDSIVFTSDACGMQSTYYGYVDGAAYIMSSTTMARDLELGVTVDEYIARLVAYRFYRWFGRRLPADRTPYAEFRRAIPNHFIEMRGAESAKRRFFPTSPVEVCTSDRYPEVVKSVADILSRSMALIGQKFDRPAISLTGGVDSRTTLASATGSFEHYSFFSYISSDTERPDAVVAAKLCAQLGLPHKEYEIPGDANSLPGQDAFRELMTWNYGDIGAPNPNDLRKRLFFLRNDDFETEVKSWASEVGRAYYSKRFLKRTFPERPTARYLTTLYKVFAQDRRLARDTDRVFGEFLNAYYGGAEFDLVWWPDLFFWEHGNEAGHGQVITNEHRVSFDITLPYNNRSLLTLMLTAPLSYRIEDRLHRDVIRRCSPILADIEYVTNVKHTNLRARLERLYLEVHSRVPF